MYAAPVLMAYNGQPGDTERSAGPPYPRLRRVDDDGRPDSPEFDEEFESDGESEGTHSSMPALLPPLGMGGMNMAEIMDQVQRTADAWAAFRMDQQQELLAEQSSTTTPGSDESEWSEWSD